MKAMPTSNPVGKPTVVAMDEMVRVPLPGLSQAGIAASFVLDMVNPHDNPAALKELQDAIYRDKVLRAREMTNEQRFDEALELTNGVFERMAEGVMWQLGITDPQEAWAEVRRRMDRLCRARDHRFYVTAP